MSKRVMQDVSLLYGSHMENLIYRSKLREMLQTAAEG